MDILDLAETDIGTLYLTRREVPGVPDAVVEILIGDEVLMSSLIPVSERRLATRALALHQAQGKPSGSSNSGIEGRSLDVLVGGLGLGYTAMAALENACVGGVRVIEKMDIVINWMHQGLLPLSQALASEPRLEIVKGDVYRELRTSQTRAYDIILVDVDHAPDDILSNDSASFYTVAGQRQVAKHLRAGGVLGVWSAVEDSEFSRVLSEVYSTSFLEEVTWQDPEFPEADFQNVLFLAHNK